MIQTDPPRPPQEVLPTMYDLPSEDPEESGLPDEFHDLQPQLLQESFNPPNYPADQIFVATDLNLYYDVRHLSWYKRPDWFAVVGVPRLYQEWDLRLSYVMWQERVKPLIVVELLSPGTEKEDLGEIERGVNQPPTKWEVYKRILGISYYVLFDRYTDKFRAFRLEDGSYREVIAEDKLWLPDVRLGLGLWYGTYQGIERLWLRWYDATGNWVATEVERRQRAEQEKQRADRLEAELRALRGES